MSGYFYLGEVEELRQAPTVENWATHLRRLQGGRLDEYVRERGSFEDYVAIIIAEASDPFVSKTAFTKALGEVVQSWLPSSLDRPAEVAMFLDLIAAYTPQNGYAKLFSKLRDAKQMAAIQSVQDSFDLAYGRDLRRKILNVLDSYFPAVEPGSGQAYREYLRQLELHLFVDGYSGHAAMLLFRRGRLVLGERRLQDVIHRDCGAISAIFREVRSSRPVALLVKDMKNLYEHALLGGDDALSIFGKEVHGAGGILDLSADNPSITLPEMGTQLLGLPSNVISNATLLKRRWAKAGKEWEKKKSQIREEARREGARGNR